MQKIGNTPLARLEKIERAFSLRAKLYAKLENKNLGGSIKDRVARAILDNAERDGSLQSGGTVIEATSGNTGIGLALVGGMRGYKTIIVMPDTMTVERRQLIEQYGGIVVLTDGSKGMQAAVEKAQELLKNTPNAILADQFNNPACATAHYQTTGVEIWSQTKGETDIFVAAVGTGGTLSGIGKYLKEQNPKIQVVAVEPEKSPLLSQGRAGAHGIQGIGANFIPSVLDTSIYDEVLTVTDEDAFSLQKLLREVEGISVGISSGANIAAAISLGRRIENDGKTIVTVLPDDGNRYNFKEFQNQRDGVAER